jgi:putative oxidoreductase
MWQKWTGKAIAIVRIIIGAFMVYHGIEIFDSEKMAGYEKFLTNDIKMGNAVFMSFLGKSCELIAGFLLILGLFTRVAAVLMAITMSIITFRIGQGRVYMEEQHPFMFVLFALIFFVDGGSKWSLDNVFFRKTR